MNKAGVLVGGKYSSFDIGNTKALTSIPGWAEQFNRGEIGKKAVPKQFSRSSWAYRCIEIRSDALASIPWKIVDGNGDAQDDTPIHKILANMPEMDQSWLFKVLMADLDVYGGAFWLKVRNKDHTSAPLGLQRLNPSAVEVKASSAGISNFEYKVDGKKQEIDRDDVVYFPTYDPINDLTGGVSPLEVCAEDIEAEYQADLYLADFFKNHAVPPVIFTTKEDVREEELQKAEARWLKKMRGAGNRHKTTFTSKGLTPVEIGYSVRDLAMDSVREEARRAICASFGVPMPLAGASEATNYATMTEQRKSLYTETLNPISVRVGDVITNQLVREFDDGLRFVFDHSSIPVMQPDKQKERESIARLVEAGAMRPDAAMQELGWPKEYAAEALPTAAFAPGGSAQDRLPEPESKSLVERDLRKYRRKALNRLKENGSAECDFVSEHVPEGLLSSIRSQLDTGDFDEVNGVFDDAMNWRNYP